MTDPGWRVINAGYEAMCAVCREGDRLVVALPFSQSLSPTVTAIWLCRTCALGAVACLNRGRRPMAGEACS